MPTNDEFKVYREALAAELQPAMGCTEPIALAYAAAEVGKRLGGYPEAIDVEVSRNIVKNVKSVIVPNTGGLSGIEAAVAAGFVCRRPEARLQVLADVSNTERAEIRERAKLPMTVRQSHEPDVFFIKVTGSLGGKTAAVTIRTYHTNITRIEENGVTILSKDDVCADAQADGEAWSIPELIKAARVMPLMEAETLLIRQIDCNSAIAAEGLKDNWGATIGKILLARNPEDPATQARA